MFYSSSILLFISKRCFCFCFLCFRIEKFIFKISFPFPKLHKFFCAGWMVVVPIRSFDLVECVVQIVLIVFIVDYIFRSPSYFRMVEKAPGLDCSLLMLPQPQTHPQYTNAFILQVNKWKFCYYKNIEKILPLKINYIQCGMWSRGSGRVELNCIQISMKYPFVEKSVKNREVDWKWNFPSNCSPFEW